MCGHGLWGKPDHGHVPNDVLLITIDTARADHYSFAGPSPISTVVADEIAGGGAAFLTAVAPSPITLVSHASLFTGQDPFEHRVRNNGEFALAPEAATLADLKFRTGDYAWSADAWGRAAYLAPNNARYHELEGLSLEQLGRFEAALEACERALPAEPDRTTSRDLR